MDRTQGLITTGEVARRLGCSRQHVVDLCDRGDLPCVKVGKHRRIPVGALSAADAAVGAGLSRDQERSLWLHRAVAIELLVDPDATLAKAAANLDNWQGVHRQTGAAEECLGLWRQTLDHGVDAVADVLTSPVGHAIELRQNSPFAGVLEPSRRACVLEAIARHWRREHQKVDSAT